MRRFWQNRWTIIAVTAVVLAGLFLGVWIPGGARRAEAVIGGFGNVTAADNPHNFSYSANGIHTSDSSETRVCVFCHTPHQGNMNPALLNAPLWNHTLSSGVTYSVMTPGVYTDANISGNVYLLTTPLSTPDGASRLCLSCHDGTISVGDVWSEKAAGGIPMATDSCLSSSPDPGKMISNGGSCTAYIGTNLTQMHVVSIPMNSGLITDHEAQCGSVSGQTTGLDYPWNTGYANTVFLRPTTATYKSNPGVNGSTARSGCGADTQCTKNYGDGYNYGIQCSTCHDPHYWANGVGPNVQGYRFLVQGINNLCSACHTATCP